MLQKLTWIAKAETAVASAEEVWSFSAVSEAKINVCVSGGAGGIGQPMSMLMAMNPLVKEVSIQDMTMTMVPLSGVDADLSHLEYPSNVFRFAIDPSQPAGGSAGGVPYGCHLVLVPAGMPRKPGMTVMTSLDQRWHRQGAP